MGLKNPNTEREFSPKKKMKLWFGKKERGNLLGEVTSCSEYKMPIGSGGHPDQVPRQREELVKKIMNKSETFNRGYMHTRKQVLHCESYGQGRHESFVCSWIQYSPNNGTHIVSTSQVSISL